MFRGGKNDPLLIVLVVLVILPGISLGEVLLIKEQRLIAWEKGQKIREHDRSRIFDLRQSDSVSLPL